MKQSIYPLAVLLGGACFGVLSTFVKLAYAQGFQLAEVTGSQFIIGTLLIWLLVLFTKKQKITGKRFAILAAGGIPMGLTGIFYYQSLQTLDASLAIIFLFQFVWVGTLLEYILDKKKPSKQKLGSIFLLIIGSILAAGVISGGFANISMIGIVWGILAAISFSSFAYVSGNVGRELPPIQRSAIFAVGGLIITFIIFPPLFLLEPTTVMAIAPYGLLLGLFGVTLPPLLFAIGMPHVGAGLGTILSSSELPVALLMSILILNEQVLFSQWVGVVIIIFGIIFGNMKFKYKSLAIHQQAESSNQHSA
ncbi:multidrug DMT transporter permease [Alkalihalobacillus alcalophilus ATCC 27647 = CGMCC 1.3604]|jgi:drug/metabolite transporter (DMT)-like permease|uniref:Drug/putative metabolite transporter n=1 Tax=Alkalihalobacillus alcalophilus ATCC 27647 = CGMCC 1.3604 TaxID=1218173 RepID=J8TTP0_ALKAL|nr:DMT family transporter [Alkalihalobacillus alcalophilus]AFV25692.1 drug/putative metabolite transporter [Alkalihalobacillus alcalophilus ATCC 27647 = CGMCC 1.3604]KGA97490.1 multidrug DMT transporter permease [Alkalihalobacillus alcalophilus ATCC 27647 = CGMCC 1.3604]MED1563265.1 DMT family transporter [Alkalihalobacillus alcalophilus]THG91753.1 multidrug DMT transporter permease [Alkalihalobacillus alcalophilus ATCC 27647 = CGMCC 1.3604]